MEYSKQSVHLRCSYIEPNLFDWLLDNTTKRISVTEDADEEVPRAHSHTILFTNISLKAFKDKMKAKFPLLKGNKDFMGRYNDDHEANLRYVCKGKSPDDMPVVISNNMLSDDEVQKYHDEYWCINTKIKEESKERKKKKSAMNFTQMVAQECIELRGIKGWDCNVIDKKIVFGVVMKCLGSAGKVHDSIVVRRILNGVMNILSPSQHAKYMEQLIFDSNELEMLNHLF